MCHRPVMGVLWPVMMHWFWWKTFTVVAVKVAVHPLSQSWPRETREPEPFWSSLKRWALQASGGRLGKWMSPSWVEVMVPPCATVTLIGVVVGRMFWQVAFHIKKWEVAALSRAPVWVDLVGGVEPSKGLEEWVNSFLFVAFLTKGLWVLGCPPNQLLRRPPW